jgi:hypothetical protein
VYLGRPATFSQDDVQAIREYLSKLRQPSGTLYRGRATKPRLLPHRGSCFLRASNGGAGLSGVREAQLLSGEL